MARYAIFSAIVGGYDQIHQPSDTNAEFDYFLFSNDIEDKNIGVWQIKPIPYDNTSPAKIARWVKTHPDILLPKYKFTLWIDANIQITSPYIYDRCGELLSSGVTIASIQHPARCCIYDETICCTCEGAESEHNSIPWLRKIYKEHYPLQNGLNETGILFRVNNDESRQFNGLWWSCIEKYSKRDQFSFNYSLWKLGIPCELILPPGTNSRNTKHFFYHFSRNHLNGREITQKTHPFYYWYNKTFPERDYWNAKESITHRYEQIYQAAFPWVKVFLFCVYHILKIYVIRPLRK